MVLQDDRLPITQVLCNPPPLLPIQDHAAKLRVYRMILIKPQTVLRDHVQLAPKDLVECQSRTARAIQPSRSN